MTETWHDVARKTYASIEEAERELDRALPGMRNVMLSVLYRKLDDGFELVSDPVFEYVHIVKVCEAGIRKFSCGLTKGAAFIETRLSAELRKKGP